MTKYKFLNILFVLALVLSFSGALMVRDGNAQDYQGAQAEDNSDVVYDPILGTQREGDLMKRNNKDERYAKTTYENLSKMYWGIYALKLTDDQAIDDYLRINECDIWKKYYHSDFQWEEIREATRKSIAKNRYTFPVKFEISLPLSLGRYNIDREVFEIEDITKFRHMKKMDITLADKYKVCHNTDFIDGYPGTAILILDRPFHLVEIPIKPELARLYIKEASEKFLHMDTNMRVSEYERQAFLRVLVTFNSYVNTVHGAGGRKKAVVHAKIDAIEVYADPDNTKPLYIKDFSEIRRRRKDRAIDSTTNDDIDKAFQYLLSSEEEDESDNMMLQ